MRGTALAFNRVLALFLSFILGFLSFAGALVGVGYVAYTQVSIDNLEKLGFNIDTDELFDPDSTVSVNSLTLQKLVSEIATLSQMSSEISLESLVERYGLIVVEDVAEYIPPKLWSAKFSELFGENGGEVLLDSVDVDFILKFIPEDVIAGPLRDCISGITLADVVELNLGYIFDGVELGFLLGVQYIKDENGEYVIDYADDDNPSFVELIAPLNLGNVLTSVSNEEGDLFAVVRDDIGDVMVIGIIEAIAQTDIALSGIFGDKTIGDLIVEVDGGKHGLDLLALIDGASLGTIMGYYYDEEADEWLVEEGGEKVDATIMSLCSIKVSDLIEPGTDEDGNQKSPVDIIMGAFEDKTFGDLLGYYEEDGVWYLDDDTFGDERTKADAITASLCGIAVGDLLSPEEEGSQMDVLMDALGVNTLGEIMGYVYDEGTDSWYVDDGAVGEDRTAADSLTGSLCGITLGDLLDPEGDETQMDILMDALGENTLGEIMGYVYDEEMDTWYVDDGAEGEDRTAADSLTNSLCGISLGDLLDPEGEETQMDIITNALGENTLGEIMGYVYDEEDGKWYVDDGTEGEDRTEADAMFAAFCGILLSDLMDPGENGASGVISDAFADQGTKLGDIMGYYEDGDTWYVDDGTEGEDRTEADPLFKALCGVKLSDLMDPGSSEDSDAETASDVIMNAFKDNETTLGEIMGYYRDGDTWYVDDGTEGEDRTEADALFKALCGVELYALMNPGASEDSDAETASDIIMNAFKDNETKLGEIMGYVYDEEADTWYVDDGTEGEDRTEADSLFKALCGVELYDLMNPGASEDSDAETASDVIMDAFKDNETKLGEIMGYVYDEQADTWYVDDGTVGEERTEADALFKALCGVELYYLMNPEASEDPDVKTASDVIMNAFEDTETMLGDIMGYTKELNPEYDEAEEVANPEEYDVDKYLWFTVDEESGDRTEVKGIGAIVAGYSLVDIMENGIDTDEIMNDLTLAEVFNLEKVEGLPVYIDGQSEPLENPPEINVWYNGDEQASAIISALAGYNVSELDKKIDQIYIGDVVGIIVYGEDKYIWSVEGSGDDRYILLTPDDSVTAEFADVTLDALSNGQLENEIEDIELGKFLGYTKIGEDWFELNEETGEYEKVTGVLGVVSGATTETIGTKIDETSIGELAGYSKVNDEWYEEYYGENDPNNVPASGILGALAGLSVKSLTDKESDELSNAIQKIQVADALGYKQNENGEWVDSDDNPLTGIMAQIADTEIGNLNDKVNEMEIGQIAGFKKVEKKDGNGDPVLENGEPVYEWYEEYYGENDPNNVPASGILGALAGLSVESLTDSESDDLSNAIKDIQVAEVLGYEQNSNGDWVDDNGAPLSGIMASIAGTKIGELSSKIDEITIGEILGYENTNDGWYKDENGNGEFEPAEKLTGILAVVANSTSSTLADAIEDATIGKIAGYYEGDGVNGEAGTWYEDEECTVKASGILGALSDLSIDALINDQSALSNAVQDVYIYDVLGYKEVNGVWLDGNEDEVPAVMAVIAGCKIKDVSTTLENVSIGKLLGFTYDQTKGYWVDSDGVKVPGVMGVVADSTTSSLVDAIEDATIGKIAGYYEGDGIKGEAGKWYVDENCTVEASGIIGALAGISVSQLTNESALSGEIRNISIGVVLGYEEKADGWYNGSTKVTGVIGALADSTISSIDTDIKDKYMGDLLGYTKVGDVWYEEYVGVGSSSNKPTNSLMAAVSNTKFGNLGSLYTNLTISDVVGEENLNSGFLSLIDNDTKLCDLGSSVNDMFASVTLGELLSAGLITLDPTTQSFLDICAQDWRNKVLDEAFDYIIKSIIDYYENLIPSIPIG